MRMVLKTLAVVACAAIVSAGEARAFGDNQEWVSERFSRSMTTNTYDSAPRQRASERTTSRRQATSQRRASRNSGQRYVASTVEDDVQFDRPQRRSAAASRRAERAPTFADRSLSGGERGIASYYWQPQRVAAGGWFNPEAMTAAHKTLPFGSVVRVTRSDTGQSVVVTINDRGPYIAGRIIDLSRRAAQNIGMTGRGIVPVTVSVIGRTQISRNYN
jgi:rare lipoprotein A